MTALIGPKTDSWSDEEFLGFVRLIALDLAAMAKDLNQNELAEALHRVAWIAEIRSETGAADIGASN